MKCGILFSQLLVLQSLYAELIEDVENSVDWSDVSGETVDDFDVQAFLSDEDDNKSSSQTNSKGEDANDMESSSLNEFVLNELAKSLENVEQPSATKHEEATDEEKEKNIVEYTLPEKHISNDQALEDEIDLSKLLQKGVIELKEIVIQVLDKKSTTCRHEKLSTEKALNVGDLTIELKRAFMTGEHVVPFSVTGYIEVYEKGKKIFGNWMVSSLQSAITFDHAIYDIKITDEKD